MVAGSKKGCEEELQMDNSVLARTVGGTVAFAVELGVAVSGADWWALSWRAGVGGPERGDSRQLAMAAGQVMRATSRREPT